MKIMQIQYRILPKLIQLAWYGCILSIAMLIFLPFVATSDDKARIRLSTDLNNIDSIQIQDSKVIFKTTGGKIIFNKTDSMWRVDLHQLHPKKELTEYEFWRDRYSLINQFFPDAAVRATYKTVISRAAHDFTELILLQTAGEGAVTDGNAAGKNFKILA